MVRKYNPYTIAKNFKLSYVRHMVSDFETCYTSEEKKDVRVWAWGILDILNGEYIDDNNISSFLDYILEDKNVYDIGFHNLKFDGSFIIPALYKRGLEYVPNTVFLEKWENGEDVSNLFTHNITVLGQWFSILIGKKKNINKSTPCFVHIWDTLKLFPMSLEEIGIQYNTQSKKVKVSQDFYLKIRPEGHILTADEREYLKGDLLPLAEALRQQLQQYGTIYRTKASKSFQLFKENCVDEAGSNNYGKKYEGIQQWTVPKIDGLTEYEGQIMRYLPREVRNAVNKKKVKLIDSFEHYIPNYYEWANIKKAYLGGINYVNPEFAEKDIVGPVTCIDRNSMYPFYQRNKPLPYGRFIRIEGGPGSNMPGVWIACARVSFKLKNEWNLPCIQIKEKYGRKWLKESTDYMTYGEMDKYNEDIIYFTSVDYETFKENYHFKVHKWYYHYYFPNVANKDGKLFIDKYYAVKQNADNIMSKIELEKPDTYQDDPEYLKACIERKEAKDTMTSAYGKHGTKYFLYCQETIYQGPEQPVQYVPETKLTKDPQREPSRYYCPYSAFMTAYARQDLVRAWNYFKGRAIYCDTDSIHFLGTPADIPAELQNQIDLKKTGALGLWKIEGEYIKARFIRTKTYIEQKENGDSHIICAGAPPQIKKIMNWDNFRTGFNAWAVCDSLGLKRKDHSKITPKSYPNGVALEYVNYEIKGSTACQI